MQNLKWDLNDICLVPKEQSDISSRSECQITIEFGSKSIGFLPLIASPMDTVISEQNYCIFIERGIIPCIPRGQYLRMNHLLYYEKCFVSFGLCEIESDINRYERDNHSIGFFIYPNVLIDIANGHMSKLIDIIKTIKKYWPNIKLMVGNVANPETFVNLGMAGADFVRCGVGFGGACLTSANLGVNYPLGSLITECYQLRKQYALKTKIVADGGMKNYSDIIKSLACGADFVMIGSIFNKAIESSGFNYFWGIRINNKMAEVLWRWNFPIKKKYRGMSTKSVQRSWGKTQLITAEGITKYQNVEYTLEQWTENFKDYLKSAMSYCGAKTLEEFIGKTQYIFITQAAKDRFQK